MSEILVLDHFCKSIVSRIPIELWHIISSHLSITEYHHLRLSNKVLSLPLVPTLTWEAFLVSTMSTSRIPQPKRMNLLMEHMTAERVLLLFIAKEYELVESILKNSKSVKLILSEKQLLFDESVKRALPRLVHLLLTDPEINPNSIPMQNLIASLNRICAECFRDKSWDIITARNHLETLVNLLSIQYNQSLQYRLYLNSVVSWVCLFGLDSILDELYAKNLMFTLTPDENWIIASATFGHTNILKRLLTDDRLNPSVENNNALSIACINGHHLVVQLLLKDLRVLESNITECSKLALINNHYSCFSLVSKHMSTYCMIKTVWVAKWYYISSAVIVVVFSTLLVILPSLSTYLLIGVTSCLMMLVLYCYYII
ncbi:hypothetical protein HDV02_003883 [Globomyces sp. JEL0801]|nr:hypothetical protein HDV02_003883 [Globomyces sp. JEL0801]